MIWQFTVAACVRRFIVADSSKGWVLAVSGEIRPKPTPAGCVGPSRLRAGTAHNTGAAA